MDLSAVFSKTPKGLRARASLIGGLSSHLMKVLTHVDGSIKAEGILLKFDKLTPQQLSADLIKLEQEGYIRLATVASETDNNWALTINFEPMVVEEYQSEEELEVIAKQNQAEEDALQQKLAAEKKAQDEAKQRIATQQAEQKRIEAIEKADKKAKKLQAKEKSKAEAKVNAQIEKEQQQALIAQAAAEEARKKAEAKLQDEKAKRAAQQEAIRLAEQQAATRAAKLAGEARLKNEMKTREAEEHANAAAEAKAKESARREIERISREAEETQKKADAQLKAKQEVERLEALHITKAAEKARQQAELDAKQKAREEKAARDAKLALAMKAEQEEKAHLDIAKVLRKAEEDRKKAAADAKAEKLEAKRLAKVEQEARTQAERKTKEEAQALAKQLKLNAKVEEKAKANAAEKVRRDEASIAKEEELVRKIELVKAQVDTQDQVKIPNKVKDQTQQAANDEQLEIENGTAKLAYTVQVAHAKFTSEEQANIAAKENARLEMERIGREADLVRQNSIAQQHIEEVKKSLPVLDAFDAAEAAEEAAFRAEEEADSKKINQITADKIKKSDIQATEDAGRASIKNAAIAQAKALASMHTAKSYFSAKKMKDWLSPITKILLVYVPLLLLLLVGLAHFINLSTLIKPIEQIASESIGEPVHIKKVHASLWPQPHLVLQNVSIASNEIKAIHVLPATASLFEEVKIVQSLVVEGLTIEQANFDQPLKWGSNMASAKNVKVEQIHLKNLMFSIRDLKLEPFDGKITFTETGALNVMDLVNSNNGLSVTISPSNTDYAMSLKAANWTPAFAPTLVFNALDAKALISQNRITFNQIQGEIFGGELSAKANIDWPNNARNWLSSGNFKLTNANAGALLNAFQSAVKIDGKLALNGSFTSKANQINQLAQASAVYANFDVRQGGVKDIELARPVLSRGTHSLAGDTTEFDRLTGSVKLNNGQYQFGKLILTSPQLQASGYVNINKNQQVSGRINADLAAQSRRLQANFALVGRGKDLKSN